MASRNIEILNIAQKRFAPCKSGIECCVTVSVIKVAIVAGRTDVLTQITVAYQPESRADE